MSGFARRIMRSSYPQSTVIFGYNTRDPEGSMKMQAWGKVPMGRCYRGSSPLPADGSGFSVGGFEYLAAGLAESNVVSSKRINMSIIFDPEAITSLSSPKAIEVAAYVASVPSDWEVGIVLYHEDNLHHDPADPGTYISPAATFRTAQIVLADAITSQGKQNVYPVINPSWDAGSWMSGLANQSVSPPASDFPVGTRLYIDFYDNPKGYPSGYKNYGTKYKNAIDLQVAYNRIVALGYATNDYPWGIGEMNAPRRVAPALSVLDTALGWGPLSPYDISGDGQAASIAACCDFAITNNAEAFLLFTGAGNLWNQRFTSAGAALYDDGTSSSPGPHYQGWPITTDPNIPMNLYQSYINISR